MTFKKLQIRSAWFALASVMMSVFPEDLLTSSNSFAKIANAAFANLDSKDPLVLAAAWDAALMVTVKCEVKKSQV